MRYGLTVHAAPEAEPLATAEAKKHCNIDFSEDDTYIDTLIKAARIHCEMYLRRALVNTTFDLTLDCFPCVIQPPRSPLVSVTSITYLDTNGTSTVLATSEYSVDTKREPGRIYPAYGKAWPSVQSIENAITVRFVAGYGATAASVPQTIRHAMLLLVGHWYENRESVVVGTITAELPFAVEALLSGERLIEA